jgi:macrolide transport system ATP-binding/permease protein
MNAIEVEHLYFSYGGARTSINSILKDLSFSVKVGELVAIQGPSGSGKSTLLYALGLLSRPDSGLIRILGKDVSSCTEVELAKIRNRNIGFVFQQFYLLPKTSVLDNILLPTRYFVEELPNGINQIDRAKKYAGLVGLGDRLQFYPNQLSGGQQQRVAICRALMSDAKVILADEPTGNLDSESAKQILQLLRDLNKNHNKTIIIITHDNEVANQCDRIIRIKDGRILDMSAVDQSGFDQSSILTVPSLISDISEKKPDACSRSLCSFGLFKHDPKKALKVFRDILPSAIWNLKRHKTRTALTMIGISVGIAAVLAMITLGQFTKGKILAGYADMGVNTIVFNGIPNWDIKATDLVPTPFRFFDWEGEVKSLKRIFPEIDRMSPILNRSRIALNYGGRTIDQDVRMMGFGEDGLNIAQRKLLFGRNFSQVEIVQKSSVCIIGYEIAARLFFDSQPLGQVLRISEGKSSFSCRVIGVLSPSTSNKEGLRPNLQVVVPYSFFQAQSGNWWSSQLKQILVQIDEGAEAERVGAGIKAFFEQKYGSSGTFSVDSDSVLVNQMRQFLTLFTILLSSVAFVTLLVGGVGITNMMLVSISERFREIGLRKALGATSREIRTQFLMESMIVCFVAGFIGLILGFLSYQIAIWVATKFVDKLSFEWTLDGMALFLSILSIFVVGLVSGIFPAVKAERLQIIEALRSE